MPLQEPPAARSPFDCQDLRRSSLLKDERIPPPLPKYLPSPPVALSLRTRESASLALKHIFDQQINSLADDRPPLDSVTPVAVEKRDDDAKDSGVGRSTETEQDNLQRAVAGVVSNLSAQALRRSSSCREDEVKGLEVSRKGFLQTEGSHSKSPAASASENDLSFGCWNSLHNGGNAQQTQQENLGKRYDPDLGVSFRNNQTRYSFFSNPWQGPFGSPISASSLPSSADLSNLPNSTSSRSLQALSQAFLPRAAFRPGMSNSLATRPTAQLTIFYSGMVNVYDDVPADKAHAIMLLAGDGNSTSSNFECAPLTDRERTLQAASPAAMALPLAASLSGAVSSSGTSVTTTSGKARAVTFGSAAPPIPATAAMLPAVASPAITADGKIQTVTVKRPHAGIELPHARKASLARFLEKRKDRVQVKPQGGVGNESEEKAEASSDQPSSQSKKHCNAPSRSPSPS